MKRVCLLLSLLFLKTICFAQTYPAWAWASGSGGGANGYGLALSASPTTGDIYTLGRIGSGSATIGLGASGKKTISTTTGSVNNTYEGRFSKTGAFTWLLVNAYSGGVDIPSGFARDKADNVYSIGSYGSGMAIDKHDASGTLISSFAPVYPTPAGSCMGYSVAVDTSTGDVYVAGTFNANTTFATPPTATVLTYQGSASTSADIFIAKYSSTGVCKWVVSAGSAACYDQPRTILVRNGFVYVCGSYAGAATSAGPVFKSWNNVATATTPAMTSAYANLFIAKYDTAGIVQSATVVPSAGPSGNTGTGTTDKLDMAIDTFSNIYITGYFRATATFGGTTLTSGGNNDAFIAKLLPAGTWAWAKSAGGASDDNGQGIALDKDYNPYITGKFASPTIIFGALNTLTNAGGAAASNDVFVTKYNTSGTEQWSQRGGGTGNEEGLGIAVDNGYAVYVTGTLGTAASGAIFGNATVTAASAGNPFIAKLNTDRLSIVPGAAYCVGTTTNIPFTVSTPYNSGNVFTAQLSDATGSFATPVTIGSTPGTTSGTISVTIPTNTPPADGYVIRLLASNPLDTTRSNNVIIKLNALPNVSVTPVTATICAGSGIGLAAQGANSYSWSPAGSLSSSSTAAVTASPIITTTYTITGTDLNSCVNTFAYTVTVNQPPVITVNPANPTICGGGNVVLTASGGDTYSWSPSQGLSATSGAVVTALPTISTTYTVVGTKTGCSATALAKVTVNPAPSTTVSATGPLAFCQGNSINLSVPDVGTNTYQWYRNGIPVVAAAAASYTADTSGSYRVVVTTALGCFDTSIAQVVTVNPLPGAAINTVTPTSFCVGDSVILYANTGTGFSYLWNLNGSQIPFATSATYNAKDSGSYSVIVSSASGCTSTSPAVLVLPKSYPTARVTPVGAELLLCHNGSVLLKTNNAPFLTYQWYYNNQPISNATDSNYLANNSGVYKVTVANKTGCTTTSVDKTVTILPEPVLTADGPTSFCWGSSVNLNLTKVSGPGISYTVRQNGVDLISSTDSSFNVYDAGVYDIVVNVGNACTMTTATINVVIHNLPLPSVKAEGAFLRTNPNFVTYQWYKGGNPIDGATDSVYLTTSGGTYTVSVTDTNGCTGASYATVVDVENVNAINAQISLFPNPTTSIVHINATVPVNAWVYGIDGKVMMQKDAAKDIDMSELSPGIYLIKLTDNNGTLLKMEKVVKN